MDGVTTRATRGLLLAPVSVELSGPEGPSTGQRPNALAALQRRRGEWLRRLDFCRLHYLTRYRPISAADDGLRNPQGNLPPQRPSLGGALALGK